MKNNCTRTMLVLLLFGVITPLASSTYINANAVMALTERTLGKGNQFDTEISFENIDGTDCPGCQVCSQKNNVYTLFDGNARTQLCTKCEGGGCKDDYLVNTDMIFTSRWPMNYFQVTSSNNDGSDPEEIWIKGFKNGKWVELYTRALTWTDRKQEKTYVFKNTKYFTKYRVTMRKGDASKTSLELSSFTFASDFLSTFVTDLIYNIMKIQFFQPSIMTVMQNSVVGEITSPNKNYEISLMVHPFGTADTITNLFRFTASPSSNSGVYGCRSPWLGLKEGTLDMMLNIQSTTSNNVRVSEKALELDKNNKVSVVVLGDKARLFLGTEVVASFVVPLNDRPNLSKLFVYASDQFYAESNALLKQLVYTPIKLDEESRPIIFRPPVMKIVKNVKIGHMSTPHNEFEISFTLFPVSTSSKMTSVLRFTTDETGKIDAGDDNKVPSIVMAPDSYNLLWFYGSQSSEMWPNPTSSAVAPKVNSKIRIRALDESITFYIDDVPVGTMAVPLKNRPLYENLYCFVSDNFYPAANGQVKYLKFTPLYQNHEVQRFNTLTIQPNTKNNRVGTINQFPTSEYVISAIIEPIAVGYGNTYYQLFRFTSNPSGSDDLTNYGSRSPVLNYKPLTEALGMSIVSTTNSGVKETSIGYKSGLVRGKNAHVTLTSLDNQISLYINGQLIDSTTAPLEERPPFQYLYVFVGDNKPFANARLKQLDYTPVYPRAVVRFQPSRFGIYKNRYVGKIMNPRLTNLYEISFSLYPRGTISSDWSSIIRFSNTRFHDQTYPGDRTPALFFLPDSLKIFLGQSSTTYNSHALQTTTALSFNEDNRIKITAKDDGIITLYINDKVAGSMYVPLSTRPPFREISVHASDPFYPAANADISHLSYKHIYANSGNEFLTLTELKPIKNNIIGEILKPSAEYVLSCIIRPQGTVSSLSNIFRFSRESPTDKLVYGDRYAALWMQPNSYKPRLFMGTLSDPLGQIPENTVSFIANKDNDFKIVVSGNGIMKMYINNVVAGSTHVSFSEYPPLEKLMVYVSDPFSTPANVVVRNLIYTPTFSEDSVYKFLHSSLTAQRNNLLSGIEHPSPMYTISCNIKPLGVINSLTSIFRFSRMSPNDRDTYGDRSPALLLKPGSYELLLAQGSTIDPNHNIQVSNKLNQGQDNTVRIVSSEDDMITIYVNGVNSGSAYIPLSNRPNIEKLLVYVGDPHYQAANVQVSNLMYEPIVAKESYVKLVPSFIKPEKLDLIGVLSSPSDDYIITCTIKPMGTMSDYSQYFTFKVKPFQDNEKSGDRFPTLFVMPNSQKIKVNYRLTDSNAETTTTPPFGLVMKQENEVRIEAFGEEVTLYINNQKVSNVTIPISQRPKLLEPLYVFTSDGNYDGANGYIKDLIYTSIEPEKPTKFSPETITVSKGNKIGVLFKPSSQYIISLGIKPLGIVDNSTVDGWNSLLRFTSDPSSDAETYGDRNPLLMFHPGSLDLHSTVMVSGQKNYKNIYNMKGIIANQVNNVRIVALGNEISYFVNDEKVGRILTSIYDRPPLKMLHVYGSDGFYNASNAEISNLVFTPVFPYGPVPFAPDHTISIKKNNKIGELLTTSINFKIAFTIQPNGTKSQLASILRFGRRSFTDKDHYGDRTPAFFFSPGSLKLIVAQGCTRDFSHEIETSTPLNLNKENKIEYIASEETLTLYVNDIKSGSMTLSLSNRPILEELHVYAGDGFYEEANAVIKDLVYTPLQSKKNPIFIKPYELTAVKNYKIGEINEPSSEYIVSFTLHPFGTVSGWSSILAFTSNDSGTYNDRWLGLFFKTGTYKILFHAISTSGLLEMKEVPGIVPNVDNSITVVARDDRIRLFINYVQVGAVYSPVKDRPPVPKLNVMVSAAYYGAAKVHIKHLVYTEISRHNPYDLLPTKMKLVQGKKFGDIYNTNSQYIISFGIKPLGIFNGWTQVLRFATNPQTDSGYGSRSPALYFHNDNSYDLQLSQMTTEGLVGINNMKGLEGNETTDVRIVALGHLMKVYFNNIKVGEIYSPLTKRPPIGHLQVVSGDVTTVANAEISNLVYTPIPDVITDPFYPVENGYCLNSTGVDQKDGVVDLGDLKAGTWVQQQQECKEKCIAEMNKGVTVTGCEAEKTSTKCWLHSQPVAKGNGDTNYACWVAGAPAPFGSEQGVCLESDGTGSRGRYHRTLLGITNDNNHCHRKCVEYYDQSTEKDNISGCQRDYSDEKCYAYHLSSFIAVSGEGGSDTSMCWLKETFECSGDKCDCGSLRKNQIDYRGSISRTKSGLPCQRWDSQYPHTHTRTSSNYPDDGLEGNYCRNPGNGPSGWCYTTDPNTRWETCHVPLCPCDSNGITCNPEIFESGIAGSCDIESGHTSVEIGQGINTDEECRKMCGEYQMENEENTILLGCERSHRRKLCVVHKQDFDLYTKYDHRKLAQSYYRHYGGDTDGDNSVCKVGDDDGSVFSLTKESGEMVARYRFNTLLTDDSFSIEEVDLCLGSELLNNGNRDTKYSLGETFYATSSYYPSLSIPPSSSPTGLPSSSPSLSMVPTIGPSLSFAPSDLPTTSPSSSPTALPSSSPSSTPTSLPSSSPSISMLPTNVPTDVPSSNPSLSMLPSHVPSDVPSSTPSSTPTTSPSSMPTDVPSRTPSSTPTDVPSSNPSLSMLPSHVPSDVPSSTPSSTPSDVPSNVPSDVPSRTPSSTPTDVPSSNPSLSMLPSHVPSDVPSSTPSSTPTTSPSNVPSDVPSRTPSSTPTDVPSSNPSLSMLPSHVPSDVPSRTPSSTPSDVPSNVPSDVPSRTPSSTPTDVPSSNPSLSMLPSIQPSANPTDFPSSSPTMSHAPTDSPTIETRTCWLKTAIGITFAKSRTLIPQSPTKIGQLVVTERDFTLKFTYHPRSLHGSARGLLTLENKEGPSWWEACYPCVWINNHDMIQVYWNFPYASTYQNRNWYAPGLVLNQDNEVKISLISNVVSIYINGSLKKNENIRSDTHGVSALDVYLQIARTSHITSADGYIQNLKYIPGGEA